MTFRSKSKYGNKKVVVNGIEFHSKKEARRYKELFLLEKAGAISDLRLQEKFVLIPAQYETFERYGKNGQRLKDGRRLLEREVAYIADFVYIENGKMVVEDTKGMRTPDYKIKRKMMLYFHNIKVKET